MKYEIWNTLRIAGAVGQLPDEEVEGTLLVGDDVVGKWAEGHTRCGHDLVAIRPAVVDGKHAWLRTSTWCAAHGYYAEGTADSILTFEVGVALLLRHGCYTHLWADTGAHCAEAAASE